MAKMNRRWVPQEVINNGFFTTEEILDYQLGFLGVGSQRRATKVLLQRLSLGTSTQKSARISGGMKRRLMIAKALYMKTKTFVAG